MVSIQEVKETSMTKEERTMLVAQFDDLFQHIHQLFLIDYSWDNFDNVNNFRAILMDPHPLQEHIQELQYTAKRVGAVISNFDLNKMDSNMVRQLGFQIFKILSNDPVHSARTIFRRWARPLPEYYPRTGQHPYVDPLMEYLDQVTKVNADDASIGPLKFCISQLQPMLQMVSNRLLEIPERRKEYVHLKILIDGITDLAYDVEYAVDLCLVGDIPIWYSVFWLQDIQLEFNHKLEQLNAESGDVESIISEIVDGNPFDSKITPIMISTEINEKLDEITKAVADNVDLYTWSVCASYKKRKNEVFLQLLSNASSCDEIMRMQFPHENRYTSDSSEEELLVLVNYLLQFKRAFIIFKEVDDIEDFDDIMRVLPHDHSSQKIIVTTHSPELVAYCHSGCRKDLFITKICEDRASTSQYTEPTIDDDVIGFEAETKDMLAGLIGEPKHLHIISMVGMAGQGKTTLAKKLYNHFSVVNYFDIQAWVCVSQVYLKRDLLLELLSQVVQISDTIRRTKDEDLPAMLWRALAGRRFLVVLDDLWDTQAWDDLKRCFPDQNNGSRIVFTTRQERLASKVQSRKCILQHLNPLSDDESWVLLQKKLFQKQSCPRELLKVGRKIAKSCKGLPLYVVLTAGVLTKMKWTQDAWEEIAENLSSSILNDAKAEDKGVIELSYRHLPDCLRPCFLYFGAFVEDQEVLVHKLIRLWIAEGFIKHSSSKCLEDVAADYLLELIERSLVMVAQEKSNGGVKSCRVHDLLREFALTKAREGNFLEPIQGYNEQLDSSSESITFYRRRLCIYSTSNHFFNLRAEPLGPLVRSLLFFAASDMSSGYSYDISFIFRNFKLLRILNFEDINIGNSLNEIDVLLHLRYLAIQGTMVSVPPSISNLWNLETFFLKSLEDKVVEVPDSIWNIAKLRHLHIDGHASFGLDPKRLENSFVQDNLQTLSTPSLAYGDDMEKMLRKLRGIRKLKCNFLDSWDDVTKCNQFPVLEFLKKLESLKVFYSGKGIYPCQFNFPSNLKKLTLTNFCMPWSEISQLTTLENLEVLKLLENAFEGERWEMEDEVFKKLKFLKLDTLNVVEWIATDDNFPVLERLILHKCEKLKEIPPGIGDIPTLLMVEVKWCSRSVAISTREIQEMQSDVGNYGLKINVHPKIWDSESSS